MRYTAKGVSLEITSVALSCVDLKIAFGWRLNNCI